MYLVHRNWAAVEKAKARAAERKRKLAENTKTPKPAGPDPQELVCTGCGKTFLGQYALNGHKRFCKQPVAAGLGVDSGIEEVPRAKSVSRSRSRPPASQPRSSSKKSQSYTPGNSQNLIGGDGYSDSSEDDGNVSGGDPNPNPNPNPNTN